MLRVGGINGDEMVRRDGTDQWVPLRQAMAIDAQTEQPQTSADGDWIIRRGQNEFRAPDLSTLTAWCGEGRVRGDDFIFHPSAGPEWQRAGVVPQLAGAFRPVPTVATGTPLPERKETAPPKRKTWPLAVLGVVSVVLLVAAVIGALWSVRSRSGSVLALLRGRPVVQIEEIARTEGMSMLVHYKLLSGGKPLLGAAIIAEWPLTDGSGKKLYTYTTPSAIDATGSYQFYPEQRDPRPDRENVWKSGWVGTEHSTSAQLQYVLAQSPQYTVVIHDNKPVDVRVIRLGSRESMSSLPSVSMGDGLQAQFVGGALANSEQMKNAMKDLRVTRSADSIRVQFTVSIMSDIDMDSQDRKSYNPRSPVGRRWRADDYSR